MFCEDRMAGKRSISEKTEKAIVMDYQSGMRAAEVATKYGVNRKTVTTLVRRNGGVVRDQRSSSGRPMMSPDAYVADVVRLRQSGLSQQAIAKIVGISQPVVGRTLRKAGMPTVERKTGPNSANWRGGVINATSGYTGIYVSDDDPLAIMRAKSGYVLEHRLVMARALGRPLFETESVHHINGDRKDNRLENLQLRQGKHGKGIKMACACCGSTNIVAKELD